MIPAESYWWFDRVDDHFNIKDEKGLLVQKLHMLGFEEDVLGWQIARLSTGEKQRLALIRGLCNRPLVLLLDEPSSSLDYHC